MKDITRSLIGFILGAGICTLILTARFNLGISNDPAPEDIPTTTSYNLQTYLHDNMQIGELSELICAVPNYNTHGGFEGIYDAKIDIVGYTDIPKDFPETSYVPKDAGIYAIALSKPVEYEVPQHPGTMADAPSNCVPILLIRDDIDRGVSIINNYGAGYPFYVLNTETNDVFRSSIYALSEAKTLDDAVNNSVFRISGTDAVTYGIVEAPTNIRVNSKAQ